MVAIRLFQDHLHIRGEHLHDFTFTIFDVGSPPHTWRTLEWKAESNDISRITSTYVENTQHSCQYVPALQDHLHIRGEHIYLHIKIRVVKGSPPHTWRTQIDSFVALRNIRITSTYVENTCVLAGVISGYQDHLHIRGEHCFAASFWLNPLGTPPHTWRTLAFMV